MVLVTQGCSVKWTESIKYGRVTNINAREVIDIEIRKKLISRKSHQKSLIRVDPLSDSGKRSRTHDLCFVTEKPMIFEGGFRFNVWGFDSTSILIWWWSRSIGCVFNWAHCVTTMSVLTCPCCYSWPYQCLRDWPCPCPCHGPIPHSYAGARPITRSRSRPGPSPCVNTGSPALSARRARAGLGT